MTLDALVGDWTVEMLNSRHWEGSVHGEVSFEWLDGGGFLVERWTVELPGAPNGVAVIGPREGTGELVQHYFDSRGVARVYEMSLDDGEWRLWRDGPEFSQRFTARLDGDVMRGTWDMAEDGTTYVRDFDLIYRRLP